MYKSSSNRLQRYLAARERAEQHAEWLRGSKPPKRQRPARQQYRPPLTVQAFASAREYLKAREQLRTHGRRILYPVN